VLDLKPGVGLDEGDLGRVAGIGGIDQELERASVAVPCRRGEFDRRFQQAGPHTGGQAGCRGDLDQLLALALDAALALPQMRHRAGAVADDLHFDMAREVEQAFDIEFAVAERGQRLRPATLERGGQVGGGMDRPHATSAAAGDGLDHDRRAVAEFGHERLGRREIRRTLGARHHGHTATLRERARRSLVAEQVQGLG